MISNNTINHHYTESYLPVAETREHDWQNHEGIAMLVTQPGEEDIVGRTRLMLSFFNRDAPLKENLTLKPKEDNVVSKLVSDLLSTRGKWSEWQTAFSLPNLRWLGTLIGQEIVKYYNFDYAQVTCEYWVGCNDKYTSVLYAEEQPGADVTLEDANQLFWIHIILDDNVIKATNTNGLPILIDWIIGFFAIAMKRENLIAIKKKKLYEKLKEINKEINKK